MSSHDAVLTPIVPPEQTGKAEPPRRAEGGVLSKPRGIVVTVIVALLALAWLFPLLWALLNSFRSYEYTQANVYLSFCVWTFD